MARSRRAGVLSHSVCNASLLSSLRCFHSSTRYVTDHARVVDDLAASFADAYPSASTTSASVPASSPSSSMPQYTYKRPHGVVQRAIQTILKQSPYTHAIPTLHYVTKSHLVDKLLPPALAHTDTLGGIVGLDIEWNFGLRMGKTAVAQLATANDIFVIHLSQMKRLPDTLVAMLQDPHILKSGVAVRQDLSKLQRDFGIETCGALELSRIAWKLDPERWSGRRALISLRDLCAAYLGCDLAKGPTRTSSWTQVPLTNEQITYAASDAYVSLELAHAMLLDAYAKRPMSSEDAQKLLTEVSQAKGRRVAARPSTSVPLAHNRAWDAWVQGQNVHELAEAKGIRISTAGTYVARALAESITPVKQGSQTWHRLRTEFSHPSMHYIAVRYAYGFVKQGVFTYPELHQFLQSLRAMSPATSS